MFAEAIDDRAFFRTWDRVAQHHQVNLLLALLESLFPAQRRCHLESGALQQHASGGGERRVPGYAEYVPSHGFSGQKFPTEWLKIISRTAAPSLGAGALRRFVKAAIQPSTRGIVILMKLLWSLLQVAGCIGAATTQARLMRCGSAPPTPPPPSSGTPLRLRRALRKV